MKIDPTKRDLTKYCEFHRHHGHRTDDCIQLRKEIEFLIRRGHLRRFVASEGRDQALPPSPHPPTPTQHQQPLGEIHVTSRGFTGVGESSSARKAYFHSIRIGEMLEIQAVSKLPWLDTIITFSDFDMEGCQHPHDDPLVVKAVVANKTVNIVLVDNGSSVDIIFASAFDKMGVGREKLEPVNAHLRGFSGERVLPLGSKQLVLTLGDPSCQATITVRFLIMDAPSAYNILLGRPSLNSMRAIPSAHHMVIKFPTANGVGMVRGYQRIDRECYLASMKQKAVGNIYMDKLDMRDEMSTRLTPSEELEPMHEQPEHPAESFQVLKNYNIKLNSTKCAFEVSAEKFLGFMVNNRGIEANPDKIKPVLDMHPSSNTKEIQRLTWRIAALSRFVSRSWYKCQPFFQVLKKAFHWDA